MKVSKISMKLIKPHTPTPQNLKTYYISLLDKFTGPMNIGVILFYESKPENNIQLEESLSKLLVQFYPLAGRYMKKDHLVNCRDEGVEFVEAEAVDVDLIDLVAKIDTDQLNYLLPYQHFRTDEAPTDPLLSIQATHFRSGGMTLAVSVSHRLFDGSSLGMFITAWSNANNPSGMKELNINIRPCFDLPSLLPNKEHDFSEGFDKVFSSVDPRIVKMFSFNVARLKSNVINGETMSPVRAVTAVIAKALIQLDRAKHGGRCRDFVITQPVNMRGKANPPPPRYACGNFSFGSITQRRAESEGIGIGTEELCELLGEAVRESVVDHTQILSPKMDGRDSIIVNSLESIVKQVITPDTNAIHFTDLTRFGLYHCDFGWGYPVWTGIGPLKAVVTTVVLMSSKEGDEIEAWVHLTKNDMLCFEQDEDIIFFATNCRNQLQSKL